MKQKIFVTAALALTTSFAFVNCSQDDTFSGNKAGSSGNMLRAPSDNEYNDNNDNNGNSPTPPPTPTVYENPVYSGSLIMRDKLGGYTQNQFSATVDGLDLRSYPTARVLRYYGYCRIGECHTGSPLQWSGPRQTPGSALYRANGAKLYDSGFEILSSSGAVLYSSGYNVCGEEKDIVIPEGATTIRSHGSGVNGGCLDWLISDSYLFYQLWAGSPSTNAAKISQTKSCIYDQIAPSLCVTTPQ